MSLGDVIRKFDLESVLRSAVHVEFQEATASLFGDMKICTNRDSAHKIIFY